MDSEVKQKLYNDPNFINIKRFDYSLKKLISKYPEGVPPKIIAQALDLSEPELESLTAATLAKIRTLLEGQNVSTEEPGCTSSKC